MSWRTASFILLIGIGVWELLHGPGFYRGVEIHPIAPWMLITIGGGGLIYSCYTMKKQKRLPDEKLVSDEELAKAKAEMDALYLREHGELPQRPKPEKVDTE